MKIAKKTLTNASQNLFSTVHEAYEQLHNALMNINTNEQWLQYLSFQSRFYNYSFNNSMLIYIQNPDASFVAGYKNWQDLNRYVKKGQRSIRILAPCRHKIQNDVNKEDTYKIIGFKSVSVFDISQTDGSNDFLPTLISGLTVSVQGELEIYKSVLSIIPIPVREIDELSSKGCYYLENPSIEIRSNLSVVQKIKTLCHEFTHHLHHTKYFEEENYELSEVIAESSAFIVCSYLGIDTSDYSLSYIKSWSDNINNMQIIASKTQKISAEIITLINEAHENTESILAV
jgi:antirestriction protein ArdC